MPSASAPSRSSSAARSRVAAALPARPARHGASARPGGRHQRLLRAGDDDVDPPGVGLERHGAEARDGVDDDERAGLASRPRRAPGCRATTPVEVSECVRKTASTPPSSRERARRGRSAAGSRPTRSARGRPRSRTRSAICGPALAEVARRRRRATRSPGEQRFATADSIAPVPEAVKSRTSRLRPADLLQPRRGTRRRSAGSRRRGGGRPARRARPAPRAARASAPA